MTAREAIQAVAQELTDELVVCTTGYTCRDMQTVCDRAANFYMIGSMGIAASIGLGMVLENPHRRVVVFDGDGSLLMGLGILPMVGALGPKNFFHVLFDNEAFASTGAQPTYSSATGLDALARLAGYRTVRRVERLEELAGIWRQVRESQGPAFLLVKCRLDAVPPRERVRLAPEGITSRFKEAIHAT